MLMPGSHSQLGELVGVVGGRERRMVNVCLPVVCLEPMTHRSRAQTTWPPGIRTHTCMHPHMHAQISLLHQFLLPSLQGMLKFTLTVIVETANKLSSKRVKILHSLYQLLGKTSNL